MNYTNHLKLGYNELIHKGKTVVTSSNSVEFKESMKDIQNLPAKVGTIPPGFEHRADKISNLFYNTPDLDWLICWTNNISDPFQQLNVGDRIRIVSI